MQTGPVTGKQINDVLRLVRDMTPVGDEQLTILARALVTACKSTQVSRRTALVHIDELFNEPTTLVPLDGL